MSIQTPVLLRDVYSWPRHADAQDIPCAPLDELLSMAHDSDLHFVAYEAHTPCKRLSIPALAVDGACVNMVYAVFDLDDEVAKKAGEPARDLWREEQLLAIASLPTEVDFTMYNTRGGMRLVAPLAEPVVLRSLEDGERWKVLYDGWCDELARYDVITDRACKDWTRLYRLPNVKRDGVDEVNPVYGTPLGIWQYPVDLAAFSVINVKPQALTSVDEQGREFPPASPALMSAARSWLKRHGPAISGRGGDQHTFVACAKIVRGFALSDAEAVDVLSEWDRDNVPPWGGELRTKMDNSWSYGSGTFGEERLQAEREEHIRATMGSPGTVQVPPTPSQIARVELAELLSPAADVAALPTPSADAGDYAAALDAAATDILTYLGQSQGVEQEKPMFRTTLFGAYKKTAWLIDGLVVEGGISVIATEPKSAKTWLATEAAVAVATGTPMLGQHACARRHVAYFYTEDMARAIDNRIRSLAAARNIAPASVAEYLHVEPRGRSINVTSPADCARIVASVRTLGDVGLVILDPLRNIHTGKENEADSMSDVFRHIRMIAVLTGATVLIVHHSSKPSETSRQRRPGQRMRGSGAIHGFVDSGIYLEDLKGDCVTTFTNTMRSEVKAARSAKPCDVTLTIVDDANGEAIKASWHVAELGNGGKSDAENVDSLEDLADRVLEGMGVMDIKRQPVTTRTLIATIKGGHAAMQSGLRIATQNRWIEKDRNGKYTLRPEGRARFNAWHETPTEPVSAPAGPSSSGGYLATKAAREIAPSVE